MGLGLLNLYGFIWVYKDLNGFNRFIWIYINLWYMDLYRFYIGLYGFVWIHTDLFGFI